ncbi:hypothetical protein [Acinetobacter ursingii]|uniref:hypothetical protein n=1 Tax=Acinetobacter ursingii TaxID=108980 RepID=UPI001250CE93|nr:hypothetical protein [Acinetobacter ursingii]
MILNILKKQLDESTLCPLCQAAMYFVEADQFDQEVLFHECSHCQHQVFADAKMVCHCATCTKQRKKMMQDTLQQEQRKNKIKDDIIYNLEDLSLLHKLYLLALLDDRIQDNLPHDEYIYWDRVKYEYISPNYLFQYGLLKELIKLGILAPKNLQDDQHIYYLRVRLDGYNEPSLFSIAQQLRYWFYENLSLGIPYKTSDEVKDVLFLVLYEEIIQFMQMYCRTWGIQIAGNRSFQQFCYRLLDSLAVGQVYYLIQTALDYLYNKKALQPRNENFINTNILKKTLEQYRERSLNEKWETSTLPRPMNLPLSKMSQIFLFHFLSYDERIFIQPIWRAWRKIEPRLNFYSIKRCMYCGSHDLEVDYDAADYVSLICRHCKHQDHYFTQ